MKIKTKKAFLVGFLLGILFLVVFILGAVFDRILPIRFVDFILPRVINKVSERIERKIVSEESVVIEVAEKVSPSVVTVAIETPKRRIIEFSPFGGFSSKLEGGKPQDIGTGFIASSDGLIITNKHVVSRKDAKYKVITKDGKEYAVEKIERDPNNDIAILKINAKNLKPVTLGDSSNLKVGQFVIAIGTALGEFRHTVTTGVISGLGRGIVAGDVFEGYVERLDDVIQTDAAINPGNSGGPLLNSSGEVIGVNVAVVEGAENIGFAIPINTVKSSLEEFKKGGGFKGRAFLGVRYQTIGLSQAILNDLPQGAFIVEVVDDSPAQKAGILVEDIITKIDDQKVDGDLSEIISKKKPHDVIKVELWRDGQTRTVEVTLGEFSE